MEVYLETDRLTLRRFTDADVDHLVELDSDPEVTRYLTLAKPVREEVATRGFSLEQVAYVARSPAGSTYAQRTRMGAMTSPSSAIASAARRGARATRPRVRGRSSTRLSRSWERDGCSP